jgi:rhodanese-related sulfurtransferase
MSFVPRHLGLLPSTIPAGSFAQQPSTMRPSMRLFSSPADISHVGKARMEQIIEEYESGDSDFIVIDVRTEDEIINTGKLSPNTLTLPVQVIMQKNVFSLNNEDFEDVAGFEKPAPDTTLVFSCAAGIRSVYACQFASQAGYSKLINYAGGANEWFQPTRF